MSSFRDDPVHSARHDIAHLILTDLGGSIRSSNCNQMAWWFMGTHWRDGKLACDPRDPDAWQAVADNHRKLRNLGTVKRNQLRHWIADLKAKQFARREESP